MDLIIQLKRDEGEVLEVYLDSQGIPTAGVGHNLAAHGIDLPLGTSITQAQSDEWLQQDIDIVTSALEQHLPWTLELGDARKGAFQNLCFNMGIFKLLGFHHMLGYAQDGQWPEASAALLDSNYARQVGARANRLAEQLSTGEWV